MFVGNVEAVGFQGRDTTLRLSSVCPEVRLVFTWKEVVGGNDAITVSPFIFKAVRAPFTSLDKNSISFVMFPSDSLSA
ncbi:hypothetical protein TNIN_283491 [Trichonephila inaurata madagascariensis]|uniref:Uncharacterized protein n=1 Tax=Trichonephila inaurata madagascariensis TaxID=2747483 RepID=A0A8X6Y3I5_9ARAC|nr:hypothetical protein TNIN_283491 [Trichonephila inaurata madagascariensis]